MDRIKFCAMFFTIIMMFLIFSNISFAVQTIYDSVNITGNLTVGGLKVASCDVKAYTNGTLYCGTDATGGAGGENYWQVDATWMWPNTTAGGKNLVNVTTLNATTINQAGYKVLDISGNIIFANITDPTDCTAAQKVTGKTGSSWDCGTDLFNTSAQIWTVIDNNTFHKFSQTITWGNLSSWSLNNAWTGSLGWGNISGYNLNSVWTGTLGGGNITSGTITSTQLASTFAILMGNVTDPTDCTAAQKVTGKTGSVWDCGTDLFNTSAQMDAAINATANRYFQIKANDTFYFAGYATSFFQNGTELFNTSTEMQAAVNQSGYYYQINVNRSNYWDNYDTPSGWDLDSSNDLTTATSWSGDLSGTGASPTVVKTQGITWGNLTTFNLNSAWSGLLGFNNLTKCADTQIIKISGTDWICAADLTGGGEGANYWATGDGWMFPNVTAGGDNDVNVTNFKASSWINGTNINGTYYGDGSQLNVNRSNYWDNYDAPTGWDIDSSNDLTTSTNFAGDISGTYNAIIVADNSHLLDWANISNRNLNIVWTGTLSGGNVSGITNASLASTFKILWGNVSGYNLNSVWTGSLGWGNLTGYDLNKAWANTLGGGNITTGTITSTQIQDGTIATADLAAAFAINLGNITNPTNCTTGNVVTGKVNNAWVCTADIDTANTTEQMQDAAGALLGGTETLITVTYDDVNNDIDFVVNNDLHSYSWTNVVDADITNTLTASDLIAVSSVVSDAEVDDAITISGAVWLNSTTGMKVSNNTKIYFGTQGQFCIFYNSTLNALVSTNNC